MSFVWLKGIIDQLFRIIRLLLILKLRTSQSELSQDFTLKSLQLFLFALIFHAQDQPYSQSQKSVWLMDPLAWHYWRIMSSNSERYRNSTYLLYHKPKHMLQLLYKMLCQEIDIFLDRQCPISTMLYSLSRHHFDQRFIISLSENQHQLLVCILKRLTFLYSFE